MSMKSNQRDTARTTILTSDIEKHIPKTILILAWPAILEQFLVCMATLTDTAMVGSIGAVATASVAINSSAIWLIGGFVTALSAGFSFLIAHAVGENHPAKTRELTFQSITCSVCLGLCLTLAVQLVCRPLPIILGAAPEVIPYAQKYMQIVGLGLVPQSLSVILSSNFRSAGNTRIPLITNLTANAANVVGNFLLIYPTRTLTVAGFSFTMWGAGFGTTGAAISTAASQYLLAFLLLYCLTHADTPIRISLGAGAGWKEAAGRRDGREAVAARAVCILPLRAILSRYRVDRRVFSRMLNISVPVLIERLTLTSGQLALTRMISSLGTAALAAHYLTNQTEGLLYLPAYGFSFTATALIGQSLGANRKDLAGKFAFYICAIGSTVIIAACIPVALFSGEIIGLFSSDPEVVALGTKTLFIAAATEIFFSFFVITGGICRGAGDVRFTLLASIFGMWGLRVGLVYIATRPLALGVVGVWLAIAVDCAIRTALCIWRLRSGKWMEQAV